MRKYVLITLSLMSFIFGCRTTVSEDSLSGVWKTPTILGGTVMKLKVSSGKITGVGFRFFDISPNYHCYRITGEVEGNKVFLEFSTSIDDTKRLIPKAYHDKITKEAFSDFYVIERNGNQSLCLFNKDSHLGYRGIWFPAFEKGTDNDMEEFPDSIHGLKARKGGR